MVVGDFLVEMGQWFVALEVFPLYAVFHDVAGCREIAEQTFAEALLIVDDDVVGERGRLGF